jgi:hemerythrin
VLGFEWTKELATGVKRIDDQHRELIAQANKLLEACYTIKGREMLGNIEALMEGCIAGHFATEEELMTDHAYPHYGAHRMAHQKVMARYAKLKDRFLKEGVGVHLVIMVNQLIISWLKSHIRDHDKALGEHLVAIESSGKP